MYRFNDGIVYIFKRIPAKSAGYVPRIEFDEQSGKKYYFDDIVTGVQEYYESRLADAKVERRIQILQDKSISSQDIAVIKGKQYGVGRIKHVLNKSAVPVTELTLERLDGAYDS